ncbi:hypothetical protein [Kitasatospora sp. NPDC004289]
MTGKYRGRAQDPVATVLQEVWTTGHLIALGLLGAVADHQLTRAPLPETSASAPDAEPPTPYV